MTWPEAAQIRGDVVYIVQPRAATCELSTKTLAPRGVSRGLMRSAVLASKSMFSWTQRARSSEVKARPAAWSIASGDTTTVKPMPFRVIGNSTAPPPIVIRIPSVFILQQSERVSDLQQEACRGLPLFVRGWILELAKGPHASADRTRAKDATVAALSRKGG